MANFFVDHVRSRAPVRTVWR